jgi:hypothetical protein
MTTDWANWGRANWGRTNWGRANWGRANWGRTNGQWAGVGWVIAVWAVIWGAWAGSAAGSDVLVGQVVPAARRIPLGEVDHGAWDELLQKYVDPQGRVDYGGWQASAADVRALDRYLDGLSSTNEEGSRDQQLAYWINAYNAVTVKGILREYPTTSIRNHTAVLFGYNIWKNLKLQVNGKQISLDDMEHQILRKMNEPRIHFAIVCASLGCPKLLNRAYLPDRIDRQLTSGAQAFFADSGKFRYDARQGTFHLSPILQWFKEDFGSDQAAQLRTIASWLPDEAAARMAAAGMGSIVFLDYDWRLNDRHKQD